MTRRRLSRPWRRRRRRRPRGRPPRWSLRAGAAAPSSCQTGGDSGGSRGRSLFLYSASYVVLARCTLPETAYISSALHFAECQTTGTRQTSLCRVSFPRHSASYEHMVHFLCAEFRHLARYDTKHATSLPSDAGHALGNVGARACHARRPSLTRLLLPGLRRRQCRDLNSGARPSFYHL